MTFPTMDYDNEEDRHREQLERTHRSSGSTSVHLDAGNDDDDDDNDNGYESPRSPTRPGSFGGLVCQVVLSPTTTTTSKVSIPADSGFSSLTELMDGSEFFLDGSHNIFRQAPVVEQRGHYNSKIEPPIDFGSVYPSGPHIRAQRRNSCGPRIYSSTSYKIEQAYIPETTPNDIRQQVLHAVQKGLADLNATTNTGFTKMSRRSSCPPVSTKIVEGVLSATTNDKDTSSFFLKQESKESPRNKRQHRRRLSFPPTSASSPGTEPKQAEIGAMKSSTRSLMTKLSSSMEPIRETKNAAVEPKDEKKHRRMQRRSSCPSGSTHATVENQKWQDPSNLTTSAALSSVDGTDFTSHDAHSEVLSEEKHEKRLRRMQRRSSCPPGATDATFANTHWQSTAHVAPGNLSLSSVDGTMSTSSGSHSKKSREEKEEKRQRRMQRRSSRPPGTTDATLEQQNWQDTTNLTAVTAPMSSVHGSESASSGSHSKKSREEKEEKRFRRMQRRSSCPSGTTDATVEQQSWHNTSNVTPVTAPTSIDGTESASSGSHSKKSIEEKEEKRSRRMQRRSSCPAGTTDATSDQQNWHDTSTLTPVTAPMLSVDGSSGARSKKTREEKRSRRMQRRSSCPQGTAEAAFDGDWQGKSNLTAVTAPLSTADGTESSGVHSKKSRDEQANAHGHRMKRRSSCPLGTFVTLDQHCHDVSTLTLL